MVHCGPTNLYAYPCSTLSAATALSVSFQTHASTVCMSACVTALAAFQVGRIVFAIAKTDTRQPVDGSLLAVNRTSSHSMFSTGAWQTCGEIGKPYRPVQNEGWVGKERGAGTSSLFQQGQHIPHCSLCGRREDA